MPPRRKKLAAVVKVQLPAGAATPAPPVGTALGPHGVNIMDFVRQYNAATESQRGNIVPVEISIYEDRSFTFVTKTPPAPELIKKAAGVDKGSKEPHKTKVGSLTAAQLRRGERADLGLVRLLAALVDAGGLLDQLGSGRRLGDERERPVLVDRDLDRDDVASLGLGRGVVLPHEVHDVDAVRAQRGTDGRGRRGRARGQLHLDDGSELLPSWRHGGGIPLCLPGGATSSGGATPVPPGSDLRDLVERELDRRLPAEDRHEHLELLRDRVDLVHGRGERRERPVRNGNRLADLIFG